MSNEKQKSDLSRAFSEDGALKTHVGGQALLEGIMMRGKLNWAVAVREPDGNIYTEEHDLASGKDKNGWLYWPFVRGCRAFVESLVLGYKALSIAAEHAFVEEEDEGKGAEQQGGRSQEKAAAQPVGKTLGQHAGNSEEKTSGQSSSSEPTQNTFSWKRDFGNPDEAIDALGAQRVLEVVDGDTGMPVRLESADFYDGDQGEGNPEPSASSGKTYVSNPDASSGEKLVKATSSAPADIATSASEGERADTPENDSRVIATSELASGLASEPLSIPESVPTVDINGESAGEPAGKKPLLGDKEMLFSMVLGLVLGIVLFVVAPAFITNLIVGEYDNNTLLWNVVDGLLRIAVFIFYIWLIGRMSDIKRMFGYHGAEHKAIHCFEHGLPMTPENARSFPRLHVRCGTAFLIMVMIIAIFVYTVTPLNALIDAWGVPDGAPKLVLVIVVRILLMPVIAGVAYEITVKWAGSHPDNPLVKVVLWPGMQMQYLTTREPDDGQIECAIEAMKIVLAREKLEQEA